MSKEISYIKYLFSKKFEIGFILMVSLLFSILLFNKNIGIEIIGYGLVISFIFLILVSLISYYFHRKTYYSLIEFLGNDEFTYRDSLNTDIETLLLSKIEETKRIKSKEVSEDKEKLKKMNEFYTLWAHQIKTPISAANLIIEDDGDLDDLKLEILKIEDYVNVLLAYFRNSSSSTDFLFTKVSLDKVIRSTIRKYSPIFIKKGIILKYAGIDEIVITDEKWLGFILEQILQNSLKYTNQGEIEIEFEKDKLIIRDTGIGIQKSDIPRLFELGFTGYNGRIYSKSTGIGLNLVKKIADSLNIEIEILSEVEKFTEVRLKFENII